MDTDQFFDALALVPNLRSSSLDDIEIKDGGNVFLFDGLAGTVNAPADLGDFVEEVQPGAFRQVLANGHNVPFLHEHRPDQLLATTKSGRLKLDEDQRGLRVRAKLVKTDLSARVKALSDSGDITGMSYGFKVGEPRNQKIELRAGKPHRLLLGFQKLLDVSTTWNPAYTTTEAQFRSLAMQYADSPESWQRLLMGAYPQLEEPGNDNADTEVEDGELRTQEQQQAVAHPRAGEQQLAAAKRRFSFIQLTGGPGDAP